MLDVSFQLKGSALTLVVLSLIEYHPEQLKSALQEKIEQAPQFFLGSPLLISFERFDHTDGLQRLKNNLRDLVQLCRDLELQPLGFTAVPDELRAAAEQLGIAILPTPAERALKIPTATRKTKIVEMESTQGADDVVEKVRVEERIVIQEKIVQRQSKVITRPVRSGQQVYAEGADLIVLAQVSEGAEVLADGNIHIYGILRGRALAGVRGDESARIYCQQLDAELVSIAGNFILQDALPKELLKKSAQVSLSGEKIIVEALVAS